MISITRSMSSEISRLTDDSIHNYKCQASYNSDGNITLRKYDPNDKNNDVITIFTNEETAAIIQLMYQINKRFNNIQLPF